MGDKTCHVGAIGTATVAKLAQNLSAFMIWQTMAEVFSMGVKAGVDPLELWEALRLGSVGKQAPLMLLVNRVMPGKYEPAAFALNLAYKDMKLAMDVGRELGIPMRLASLTMDQMTEAVARRWGEQDARSTLELQLERAGVEIAVDPQRMKKAVNRKLS